MTDRLGCEIGRPSFLGELNFSLFSGIHFSSNSSTPEVDISFVGFKTHSFAFGKQLNTYQCGSVDDASF